MFLTSNFRKQTNKRKTKNYIDAVQRAKRLPRGCLTLNELCIFVSYSAVMLVYCEFECELACMFIYEICFPGCGPKLSNAPTIIVMVGLPARGKTYIGKK